MKPITSIALVTAVLGVGYEYLHSINARFRLHSGAYKKTSVSGLDIDVVKGRVGDKKMFATPMTILKVLHEDHRDVFNAYEFEDVVILADDNYVMTRIYNDKVVKRCVPSFLRR